MGKNFSMNLEDFTIYFIIITFALYVASRYIKTESFQVGDNTTTQAATMPPIRDWKYKWRQRRNELIPKYDPEGDDNGLIYDADPARANSLRKSHASHLIDLYKLDEDVSSNIIDLDDVVESEFWAEWRVSRWRNKRDVLLETLEELNDAVTAGEATAPPASEEEQAAGRQAQQLITTYRLDADTDDDDNEASIIQPRELSDKVAATVAPDEVTPSPFNDIYLDNYVTPLRGIGCKMTPWGQEICKPDITSITLEDIDNKIKQLTRVIADEERDINISGGDVTINVDQDGANIVTDPVTTPS